MRIVVVRDPTRAVVSARAVWPGGMRLERAATAGLTRLMTESWTAGCGKRDLADVSAALERTEAAMWGVAGRDSVELAAEWPLSSWRPGLALFADCALAPRFAAAAVDRARRRLLVERAARERSAEERAWQLLVGALFGAGAYGADPLGTHDSLAALDRGEIAAHFADAYPAGAMAIAVVGDVDPDAVIAAARAAFGSARARGSGQAGQGRAAPTPPGPFGERQVFGFLPGELSAVAIGFPGVAVSHPDRAGLDVLAEVLAARVGAKLRLERGLVHRVNAMSIEGAEGGMLAVAIACRADRTTAAVTALRAEIDGLRSAGPSADELVRAVRLLRQRDRELAGNRLAAALAAGESLGTAGAAARRRAQLGRMRLPDLAGLAARTLAWDAAVVATVMPPRASPEAARRTRGSVRSAPKRGRR